MPNKINNKGIIHLVILIIAIVIAISGIGYYAYSYNSKGTNNKPVTSSGPSCKVTDGIEICITTTNTKYEWGIEIPIKTRITNNRTEPYKATFSCTDTTPWFYIDGDNSPELNLSLCGQAITYVSIDPEKVEEYEEYIPGSYLEPGRHTIETSWSGIKSGKLNIDILEKN